MGFGRPVQGRTDEQKAADRAPDEAVKRVADAYGHVDAEHIITDWVVIGVGVRPGPGGGGETTLGFYLLPDGGDRLNWHKLTGMVRAA